MSILKFALIGAAVAYGINHITKKRADGTSILDELTEKAPEWVEKGKQYAEQAINQVTDTIKQNNASATTEQL
jgi:hypothetical protein